ncbi:ExeM/NucH family extracellular endonuclease [Demequina capsici]|uniref:ExeM/NucH family extracellular endonuclease n=1 Tax=Demequina capsici TaxID=3075620 RepID=A0AA96J9Q9_9MICO|nr:ExeM/NucH family extracellular endonuclease [Demequina sp. OYTSA14]WNM23761.1 ExeM/NucH family extracellular endonuclease [Demequina sp. OYTSA14]
MRARALASAALVAMGATTLVALPAAAADGDALHDLIISEYIEGSSSNKAIEIYNGTTDAIDLGGYTLALYSNGATSATYHNTLSGTIAAGQTQVYYNSSATQAIKDVAGSVSLSSVNFNGDDAVVLYYGDVATGTVVDSIGQVGLQVVWTGGTAGDATGSTRDRTLVRDAAVCSGDADPTDLYDLAGWTGYATDTFGYLGSHTTTCAAGAYTPAGSGDGGGTGGGTDEPSVTKISAIQGSGETSPLTGQIVTIEGVVVGDYQGDGGDYQLSGFHVQSLDADADGDPATSEGVFVYDYSDPVALGDLVSVTGKVTEYKGVTEIGSVTDVTVMSSGNTVTPATVTLPLTSADELERYESMLVTFPQALSVTELYNQARYGEVLLSSGGRLDQPTAVVAPGPDAIALQAANDLNQITLDDATNAQNPWPLVYGVDGQNVTSSTSLRGGDTVTGLVGVLDYYQSGGGYRVRAVGDLSDSGLVPGGVIPLFESTNPRPAEPEDVGGSIQVAGFNVLNYFLTVDDGKHDVCGAAQTMECRGADSAQEQSKQRAKLLQALSALDADVIGLAELENTPGVDTAGDLASGLNDLLGTDVWAPVETGVIGTDAIRVGMIYRTDKVALAGDFTLMDSSVDARFVDDRNRPSLAQSFTDLSTGGDFTVVANHLKSKGSCPAAGSPEAGTADDDSGDGAGCWNATRTAAAEALVDWIDSGAAGNGDPDVIMVGDFNSYAKEDPIQVLVDAGYVQLGDGDYSYVYSGQWGSLDYGFASPSMAAQVTGSSEYHINSDENPVLSYNEEYLSADEIAALYAPDMYRTSDHDPVLVGLQLTPDVHSCQVRYVTHSAWFNPRMGGGFNAQVVLTNTGTEPIDGWDLTWSWSGAEQITQAWRADVTQDGAHVTASSLAYDSLIKPGRQETFGFLGTQVDGVTAPGAFLLNGGYCDMA